MTDDGPPFPQDASVDGREDASDGTFLDALHDINMDGLADVGDGNLDVISDVGEETIEDAPWDILTDADSGDEWTPTCYYGDFDQPGVHHVACITVPSLDRWVLDRPELTGESIGPATMTRDGAWLAVTVQPAGAPSRIFLAPTNQQEPPKQLVVAPSIHRHIDQMAFSFDGKWLAFTADFDLEGSLGLYVVTLATGHVRRISPAAQAGRNVTGFAWSMGIPSAAHLAFAGNINTESVHELWSAAVDTMTSPTPIVSLPVLGTQAGVRKDLGWDSQGRILFRSNHENPQGWSLYRVHHDGAAIEKVPGSSLDSTTGVATIGSFGVSPDGANVAFSANSPDAMVFNVYLLSEGKDEARRLSQLPVLKKPGTVSGPSFGDRIAWSADGEWLAVIADWRLASSDLDDRYSAFVLSPTGAAGGTRVIGVSGVEGANVRQLHFLSDGRLAVRGDLVSDNVFELFIVQDLSVSDQNPSDLRFEQVPALGDVLGIVE